jgi:hypothetical protein
VLELGATAEGRRRLVDVLQLCPSGSPGGVLPDEAAVQALLGDLLSTWQGIAQVCVCV